MKRYVPGYSPGAISFLERRTAETHAAFVLSRLSPGMRLLDCGCGPGTITLGLARRVAPGLVVAIDREPSQVGLIQARAREEDVINVEAVVGDAGALPFPESSFDMVFSHALLEHLPDPVSALGEMRRVLAPGGMIAVSVPDWGGFLLAPPDPEVDRAIDYYLAIRRAAGGDPEAGRNLGLRLDEAGFSGVELSARYECHDPRTPIVEELAGRIELSPDLDAGAGGWVAGPASSARMAAALRRWGDPERRPVRPVLGLGRGLARGLRASPRTA